MHIEKLNPVPDHGYKYTVEVLGISEIYEGFLYGQSDPIEWWLPDCLGGCEFSDEFADKYPEIVESLE